MAVQPYPLEWPAGYPRTERPRDSQFKVNLKAAWEGLVSELQRWGASGIVISSDAPVTRDGSPYSAGAKGSHDAGVCAYFTRKNENWVIPCDEYKTIRENMQALFHIIGALRAIERHGGSQALRSASSKFLALPETGSGVRWWEVLGIPVRATEEEINKAYKKKAMKAHPDNGGSAEQMEILNTARHQALAKFKNQQL